MTTTLSPESATGPLAPGYPAIWYLYFVARPLRGTEGGFWLTPDGRVAGIVRGGEGRLRPRLARRPSCSPRPLRPRRGGRPARDPVGARSTPTRWSCLPDGTVVLPCAGPVSVGGGLCLPCRPWSFPRGPIDLGDRVKPLPEDGSVPGLPGWRWVFTPGHTPGHIALFRDSDRTLIAGDAFVTTRQESVAASISQRPELCGPPRYFTSNLGGRRNPVSLRPWRAWSQMS